MNLFLFPSIVNNVNGYGIVVSNDYARLTPAADDVVIFYDDLPSKKENNSIIITRPAKKSLCRVINVLRNHVSCEFDYLQLKSLNIDQPDYIFCGDVVFYRAIRRMYPNAKISVRFHNCFSRIGVRTKLLDSKLSILFKINLRSFSKLEKIIFQDGNVHKIFISEEDRNFYCSNFGNVSDSVVWGVNPKFIKQCNFSQKRTKIIYFGGVEAHKKDSVLWFINEVFIPFRDVAPDIEFHLFGKNTQDFNSPQQNIFGHGFYNKNDLPYLNEGIFINPDIIGGGVKIKLLTYFKEGAIILTTPFGFEGYSADIAQDYPVHIVPPADWLDFLIAFFTHEE